MAEVFFALYPWNTCTNRWEEWSSPKAVSVVMSAVPANVTTDTAFAFRSGTNGSEGHRAIADMFRWLAARVALLWEMTHLCSNPQTVGRGSARLLRKGFFEGMASRSLLSLGRFFDAKV